MRVLHIQTGISTNGNSVFRLHKAMLDAEIDSYILCAISKVEDKRIIGLSKYRLKLFAFNNYLSRLFFDRFIKNNFSYPFFGNDLSNNDVAKASDIIYLHWTQGGFINLRGLRKILKLGKPVVLSCRDFWYLTGGCHSPVICEKFKDYCRDCVYLNTNKEKDLSYRLFKRKLKVYSEFENLYVFVSSNWMLKAAKESTLLKGKEAFCIPNVLDNKIFRNYDKQCSREELSLSKDKILILFGSVKPTINKNKGWDYLVESIGILKTKSSLDVELVVFGSNGKNDVQQLLPYNVSFLGVITNQTKLAKAYSACDVYITPSLSETFGNTVLESLSCGTAVVSFNIGGASDMIDHKRNGYLVNYKDSNDLAAGILYCLENNLKGYIKEEMATVNVIEQHKKMIRYLIQKKND